MARTTSFTKRTLISKANSSMVVATTLAAFILVFTLVSGKALFSQVGYQNKVIGIKKDALKQLADDLQARDQLVESYATFVEEDPNAIGGHRTGSGPQDGDNAKLILDSLPSKYDFPALATSLEKLINDQNLRIVGISGTDQEAAEAGKQTSPDPQPVEIPFQVQVSGSYASVQGLVDVFLRSVRPFQIQTMELTGDESSMTATVNAKTYYQPEKSLDIKEESVR